MQIAGYASFEAHFLPGDEIVLDSSAKNTSLSVSSPSLEVDWVSPDCWGTKTSPPPGSDTIMRSIYPGDTFELLIPSGKLKIVVDYAILAPWDVDASTRVLLVAGPGNWDGSYQALLEGRSAFGSFSLAVHPSALITVPGIGQPVSYAIYQAAHIIVSKIKKRNRISCEYIEDDTFREQVAALIKI